MFFFISMNLHKHSCASRSVHRPKPSVYSKRKKRYRMFVQKSTKYTSTHLNLPKINGNEIFDARATLSNCNGIIYYFHIQSIIFFYWNAFSYFSYCLVELINWNMRFAFNSNQKLVNLQCVSIYYLNDIFIYGEINTFR